MKPQGNGYENNTNYLAMSYMRWSAASRARNGGVTEEWAQVHYPDQCGGRYVL